MIRLPDQAAAVRGVIFDLDGTLVDSRLDFVALRQRLGFPDGPGVLEHLATLDDSAAAAAAAEIEAFEMAGAAGAIWMPGARELLAELRALGLPTAILTRNMRAATQLTLDNLGIDVDRVLTREDCPPKPDPEGLLHIARDWTLPASEIVYIGDFRFDLEAAHNAGMIACLYRNPRNAAYESLAHWVVHHFDELRHAFARR